MARLSFVAKLNLILWKNWHVELYHWKQVIFCFCTPFMFALLLVVLRLLVKAERVAVMQYEPIDLRYEWRELLRTLERRENKLFPLHINCFMPRIAIAYAPNTTDYVNTIMMKAAADYLNNIELVSYTKTSELIDAMISKHYLVGVKFGAQETTEKNSENENQMYPGSLSFSLIFPSELRIWDSGENVGDNWRTHELFDSFNVKKHRNPYKKDGGFVGYIREGFASVQDAISMAFISLRAPDIDLPEIKLQRFPYMADTNDELVQGSRTNIVFLFIFGFLYPCMFITLTMNKEKETNIISFFQIMGLNYRVQFIAWYINSFVVLLICSAFFIAALKIHWSDGFAILTHSSWLAVSGVMLAYNLASISFTYMVSSIFVRRSTATLMLVLLWVLTFIPSFILYPNGSFSLQLLMCILSNCCMAMAFDQIIKYEAFGHGFLWSSYFDSQTIETQLTNGVLTIFLLLLSFIYTLIGLCFYHWRAGLLEMPTKIRNSPCVRVFKRFKRESNDISSYRRSTLANRSKRMSKAYEVNPDYKKIFVEIRELKKVYKDNIVVKDFNLHLFQSEIMVLMGHNGAGKSTLLSMITGMVKPTRGTVLIDNIDIRKNPESAFENLGFCLQENILIPELNVFNQITFHCRMKGLTDDLLDQEVEKYLLAMNMEENRNQNSGKLSIGLKRYLSVCCALCAESKFVVLDEPDTGMDLLVRRKFRDLLIHEKRERTILMTTHSTEEADSLADRIAIMSSGELRCNGTSNFLRKIYSNGYHLVCVKGEQCDSSVVTAKIQKFLPVRLVPESEIGTELSYRLDQKYLGVFPIILDYLEQHFVKLNIISVSIGEASIDDVFLSMGTENPSEGDRTRLTDILNGVSSNFEDESNMKFLQKTKNYKGFQLLKSQWQALLLKRFLFNFRVKPTVLLQFLMPILFTAMSFPLASRRNFRPELPSMTYRLNQYRESVTVLDIREEKPVGFEEIIIDYYQDIISSMGVGHKIIEAGDLMLTDYILEFRSQQQNHVNLKYLIAATFSRRGLKAWYNNYPLHTVPLTLNMMHNAVLKAATNDSSALITVTLEPLPFVTPHYEDHFIGMVLAINLTFCIGLVWSTSIMSLVKERQNSFKLLQYIHGARPSSYWQTIFFYDFLWTITISIFIIIIILCYRHNIFMQIEVIAFYFLTLVVFGSFILPFNYAISYIFQDHVIAFCVITIFSIFGGVTFSTLSHILAESVQWTLRIVPHFSLCNTLYKIFHNGKMKLMCSDEVYRKISIVLENCQLEPNCCGDKMVWTLSKIGLLPEVVSVFTTCICSIIAVMIIENRSVHKAGIFNTVIPDDNEDAAREDYKNWHNDPPLIDMTRKQEEIRVLRLKPKDYFDKALILQSVGRIRKHSINLHRIFLVVNHGECFGVFGTCVSGKSAFMKMLVNNNTSSYGQIYVNGLSLRSHLYEVYNQVSYCHQTSSNVDEFTGFEVLKIFCLLHGIPRSEINPICEGLARAFGYMPQYKELLKFYSPGTKRRFRISIAMLGNPSIIYLDEPMIGLDLAALRKLCHIICQLRKMGTSVLFASLRFGTSDLFCSRISFLTHGRLSHIGSPYELDGMHCKGYLVKLKVKTSSSALSGVQLGSTEPLFMPNPFLKVQTFVETAFPNAVMKDQRGNLMFFLIPLENMKLSRIFEELTRNAFMLNIETFLVSRNTLSLFVYETIEKSRLSFT